MTNLNDLIALNGMQAFHAGHQSGIDKAVRILEELKTEFGGNDYSLRTIAVAIKRIEEEEPRAV